jgi:cytochrome b6-f complex iron-sulfur subunit
MDRRTFLGWFSVSLVASSLPVALAACSQSNKKAGALPPGNNNATNPPRSDGFIAAGTVAQLNQDGQILNKESPVGALLVIRQDANIISAVNPTCTHKGCILKWRTTEKDLICPCHDARFTAEGKILEGPVKLPLPTYQVKVEGDLVLVKGKEQAFSGENSLEKPQAQPIVDENERDEEREEDDRKQESRK